MEERMYMISVWEKDGDPLQDRSIFLKVRPLKEGKWWPSIVFGAQDPLGSAVYTKLYSNVYFAASKHINIPGVEIVYCLPATRKAKTPQGSCEDCNVSW